MIRKIDHIGIAVNSIEDAIKTYTDALGLKVKGIEIVEDQKVRTAIIPVGETKIELLESTDPEGVIAKFIERKGEGLHHLALEVSNIQKDLEIIEGKGIQLIVLCLQAHNIHFFAESLRTLFDLHLGQPLSETSLLGSTVILYSYPQ